MRVSVNWLKEFVEIPLDPRELKRTLRNIGLGVESIASANGDCVLDLEVTTNRPDCLSHYGVARELSTACRVPLKKIELTLKESSAPAAEAASIDLQSPELCARYCARVLRNVEVKPSPDWLIARLASIGARPINNVADATNYVLMELGHPLHAFDLERLHQHRIIVRRARPGEKLRTLDGVDRTLNQENLVIADAGRPVALAGVMGGTDSEITSATTSVLIESAWFDPLSIRRTAKSQGMHTEASHRFERGADIGIAPLALDRAAALIKELAGGEFLRGVIDVYPRPRRRETMTLRRAEIRRILGAEVLWEDVERILRSLGFAVARRGPEAWSVTPPSFRLDVTREVDLIEEVARHYGYDRLPSRLVPAPPHVERDLTREKELALAWSLTGLGYREIVTTSMTDPAEGAQFSGAAPVLIENPVSEDAAALRTSAAPSMLRALRWNLDRGTEDLHFFEMGKVYEAQTEGSPAERRVLMLGLAGHRRPGTVHETARELDFFDLKGDVETLLKVFGTRGLDFAVAGQPRQPGAGMEVVSGEANSAETKAPQYTETGGGAEYRCGSRLLAAFGALAEILRERYELRRPVWLAEIDLDYLLEFPLKSKSFQPFSKFPSVKRDFSLVAPSSVSYGDIARAIRETRIPELRSFTPADRFHGRSLGPNDYSLLLRVTFESLDHTLTGGEITQASEKLLEALAPLSIRLRGQPAGEQ